MWQLSYTNNYESTVPYLFITTLYQFRNFSLSLFIFFAPGFLKTNICLKKKLICWIIWRCLCWIRKNFIYWTLLPFLQNTSGRLLLDKMTSENMRKKLSTAVSEFRHKQSLFCQKAGYPWHAWRINWIKTSLNGMDVVNMG